MNRAARNLVFLLLLGSRIGYGHDAVPAGYRSAADTSGIGSLLFYAIALTESGQSRMTADHRPWPWTLSLDGEAHYFPTREEALETLTTAVGTRTEERTRQIGVGLYQIEWRFHAHRFQSLDEMLDPYRNAAVAAGIFAEGLEDLDGDLWQAIGRFHSKTPALAAAYRGRVLRHLIRLTGREHG